MMLKANKINIIIIIYYYSRQTLLFEQELQFKQNILLKQKLLDKITKLFYP